MTRKTFTLRLVRTALALALATGTLTGVFLAGSAEIAHNYGPNGTAASVPHAANTSGPEKSFKVAIVLGRSGTEAADVLAPYEVFASSPKFSVYTVAEDAAPVQLVGGPALLPAHTFAEIDDGAAPAPDLLVVPAVEDPTGDSEAVTRSWIVSQSDRGIRVLGVCSGSILLAASGVLDGYEATSHWSRIASLRQSRPDVHWVSGHRYVQDGRITTTAGVTSGIPGALQLVNDVAGPLEAARVGAEIGYPGWSVMGSTTIPEQAFSLSDASVGLNSSLPWFRPTVGVGLSDGVNEIDAVAVFEVYAVSGAARTVAVASSPYITTKHGLVLVTTPVSQAGPPMDRLILVRGETPDPRLLTWATERSITTASQPPATHGRIAFDAALEELSHHAGSLAAVSTAKFIDYPHEQLDLDTAANDTRSIVLLASALALSIATGATPRLVRGWLRRSKSRRADPNCPPPAD